MKAVPSPENLAADVRSLLAGFGLTPSAASAGSIEARSPISGETIAHVSPASAAEIDGAIKAAHAAYLEWRNVPPPKRGELARLLGNELRANKTALARLVSIEAGKIVSEGLGEVQEMIDICDFAAGLSRQLYGLTIASERGEHRMMETWHPLGVTGIISAFNFPVAVWAWNAALALVCGNACVWKPSEKTPLTALAAHSLFERALKRFREEGNARPMAFLPSLLAGVRRERRWPVIPSSRLSRRPARQRWAAPSPLAWRNDSRERSSNSAATMARSSARRPIST